MKQMKLADKLALPTSSRSISETYLLQCGLGSSVGIATELRAGRSGVRVPVGGENFRTRPDRSWGPPSLLYNGYRVFPGGKEAGAWCWPPTPFYRRGQERVELYLYPPSRPLQDCNGKNLPLFASIQVVLFLSFLRLSQISKRCSTLHRLSQNCPLQHTYSLTIRRYQIS
jgi:hypothetical protein